MANEPETNTKAILAALESPQFKEIISIAVVLGMLLLFARDLADPTGFRNYLISAITIYLIGIVFLVQTQVNLINHARNQAGENSEHYPPFEKSQTAKQHPRIACIMGWYEDLANVLGYFIIRCMPLLHSTLLLLLIFYLFWRKCL